MRELILPSGRTACLVEATGRALVNANKAAKDDAEVDYRIINEIARFKNDEGEFEQFDFDRFLDDIDYEDSVALQDEIFRDIDITENDDGTLSLPSGRVVQMVSGKTRQLMEARRKAGKDASRVAYYIIAELTKVKSESGEYEAVIIEELLDEYSYQDVLALQKRVFVEKKTSSALVDSTSSGSSGTASVGRKSRK